MRNFSGVFYTRAWVSSMKAVQFSSVAQLCLTLWDPVNRSIPGLPVHHKLSEFTQTHVHWVGDAIQPSHLLSSPSPPAPKPSQHQGLFQQVNSWHEVAKVLEFQFQHQSFQWTPRTDLLWDGLVGSPCNPRDSQESSPTPQFKSINSTVQLSHPYMTTGKTIALTKRTFVGKVMSLLLNMLSRLAITFLPRSKRLLISWLQSTSAVILEPPKIKSDTVSIVSPSISHEVMGADAMILVFWMLSFKSYLIPPLGELWILKGHKHWNHRNHFAHFSIRLFAFFSLSFKDLNIV